MMRSSNLGKSEAGQVLVYVTIVLMLTLVIIPPLLGFIFGAGRTAQIREDRMLQVYAADAGIEDAYYRITTGNLTDLPDPWTIEDVNGYDVAVAIYEETEEVYRIVSTATSDSGAGVTIEAWAAALDYSYLLDNSLSSYGDIDLSPNVTIAGNVTLNGEVVGNPKQYEINGSVTYGVPGWPTVEELSDLYGSQVSGTCPCADPLEISGNESIDLGACYKNDLTITGSGTLTLTGTLYIKGNLWVGPGITVKLDGHTIYAEGNINFQPNCYVFGPGCIIAVGDVVFKPNQVDADFIFVMSVEGTLTAQPGGDFYGSFAGHMQIDMQPGNTLYWTEHSMHDLNFPEGDPLPGIRAYIIRY